MDQFSTSDRLEHSEQTDQKETSLPPANERRKKRHFKPGWVGDPPDDVECKEAHPQHLSPEKKISQKVSIFQLLPQL